VVESAAISLKKSQDKVVPANPGGLTHLHTNWDVGCVAIAQITNGDPKNNRTIRFTPQLQQHHL